MVIYPKDSVNRTYDHDRFGAKEILYCGFTENDILTGNEKGIFKTRVNR